MIIDIHSHILPGIDDGAKDWDEFLAMAEIAADEGISHMVCTPHYIPWEIEFSIDDYQTLLDEAKYKLSQMGLELRLVSGCEVIFTSDLPGFLEDGKLLTINEGGKHLLVEFPRADVPDYAKDLLFSMKIKGITPIIAHPERNMVFGNKPEVLLELIEQGALCQLNTGSITGKFGERTRKVAETFLRSNMIHLLGSDAHSPRTRAPKFQDALTAIEGLVGADRTFELREGNPLKILNGKELEPYPVVIEQGKKSFWKWITSNLKVSSQ